MRSALTRIAAIVTDLRLLTPTNLADERKKFFASDDHEPQFTYAKTDFPTTAFKDDLEKFLQGPQDPDERISTLIQERVRELLLWIELHERKGEEGFTDVAIRLHGKPSLRMLREARAALEGTPEECPTDRTLTAQDIKPRLQQALREEGLEWEVVLREDLLARAHLVKGKELRLRADAHFNDNDVKKLIVHEVQTHARRFKNGQSQPYDIFETGTAHYLETEEGLATYNEEQAGVLTSRVKRNLAARVLAVEKALVAPFSEVYAELEPLVGEDKAFEIAVSVKRGLEDTSKPGAFTKPHLYFAGHQKVKRLTEEDRKDLMVGKISFLHLPVIKELIKEGKVKVPP